MANVPSGLETISAPSFTVQNYVSYPRKSPSRCLFKKRVSPLPKRHKLEFIHRTQLGGMVCNGSQPVLSRRKAIAVVTGHYTANGDSWPTHGDILQRQVMI